MESNFVKVAEKSEVAPGKVKEVKVNGKEILIANVNGSFYAIGMKCTHAGGDLSKGTLDGNIITCPRHHAKFDVTTGKLVSNPKIGPLHPKANDEATYQVKIEQDSVMIKL
jgi:3-phenylpropionate/trans-cinnamate dioxygenase ferredoxin subunit